MQDRRMQVPHVGAVFDRPHSKFVGCSVPETAANASTGHPDGEAEVVVVSPWLLGGDIGRGRATKFPTPDDQGFVEQPLGFQVGQQGGDGLVALKCLGAVVVDVGVVIPGDVGSERQLYKSDSSFGQAASDQSPFRKTAVLAPPGHTRGGFGADPVEVEGRLGLLPKVKSFGRGKLHAECEFEGGDSRLQCWVGSFPGQLKAIHLLQQVELTALISTRQGRIAKVGNDERRIQLVSVNKSSGMHCGQETAGPARRPGPRMASMADHDEGGQILVLRAESVTDPGSHARSGGLIGANVHHQQPGDVLGDVGVHRVQQAQLVGVPGDVGKQFADPEATVTMLREAERRFQQAGRLSLGAKIDRRWALSFVLGDQGFRVERVEVGRATIHQQVDDTLGAWGEMWAEWQRRGMSGFGPEQPRQTQEPDSGSASTQQRASIQRCKWCHV